MPAHCWQLGSLLRLEKMEKGRWRQVSQQHESSDNQGRRSSSGPSSLCEQQTQAPLMEPRRPSTITVFWI